MEFLFDFGLFAAKTLFLLIGLGGFIIFAAAMSQKSQHADEIELTPLHKKLLKTKKFILHNLLPKAELKKLNQEDKKLQKNQKDQPSKPRLFVLDFDGDIKASESESLSQEVTTLLQIATEKDEVLLRLESPGGIVHGYGLAAAQLLRLREKKIPLIASVDKVAASGGYMMAVTANKILCAPFAIVGSIGVVAQLPNVHKLLKKNDIEYKEYTAGDYKRTVGMFAEITPRGEQKFLEQIEQTHILFKNFVLQNRPQVNLEEVATGEYWYGLQALQLKLVDEIKTSEDWILHRLETHDIFQLKFNKKLPLREKLSGILGKAIQKGFEKSLEKMEEKRFP